MEMNCNNQLGPTEKNGSKVISPNTSNQAITDLYARW